jgi:group II intron reverse transcriptase/maturase
MEAVVAGANMRLALRRVKGNKGSPGVDGMTVQELTAYLEREGPRLKQELLESTYQPQPVKRVEIPKPGGGKRQLGIPTVVDRLVQQAVLQVLTPLYEPSFSPHSYGFRPGKSAHQAVEAAREYVAEGRGWVVDLDLEKFFDRVNHDGLLGRLARRIGDKRVLRLIRRYLQAGVMLNGVVVDREQGTPQGGPLSPLLANVLLDDVDKELEQRGLSFVRYADDLNVYVRSKRAGEDAMQTLRRLYARLRLYINEAKSAVARPHDRKFLGYSFWYAKGGEVKRRVAPKALEAMKERVREVTARNGGRSLRTVVAELREYLVGWRVYYRLAETPRIFAALDQWVRRRLRLVQLKQWKRGRTVYRELRARGVPENAAASAAAHTRRWWRTARHPALSIALSGPCFDRMGVPRLAA